MEQLMENEQLKNLIETGIANSQAMVEGDGRHFNIEVISNEFVDKSMVQRQQVIYGLLQGYIASGEIHALNMKTYTIEEWNHENG